MFESTGFLKQRKTMFRSWTCKSVIVSTNACIMTKSQHLAHVSACPVISTFTGCLRVLLISIRGNGEDLLISSAWRGLIQSSEVSINAGL